MLNKKIKKNFFLILISTTLIIFSIYTYRNPSFIPNCSTTLKIKISDDRSDIDGYYLLSIIPSKDNRLTLLMSGEIENHNQKYFISRKFIVSYKPIGDHILAIIENIIIDPADQARDQKYIRSIPNIGQSYLMKISKLDKNNYIFEENYSPLFICTN